MISVNTIRERVQAVLNETRKLEDELNTLAEHPHGEALGTAAHWMHCSEGTLKGALHEVDNHLKATT